MAASKQAPIDIGELPLPQLQSVRAQMEEELQHLSGSYASLKQAQAKFNDSIESLNNLSSKTGPLLVPLTSSLYVPGELADAESVMVDVGTGYFIQKSVPDAKEYFKGKVTYLKTNLEKLQSTLTQREQQYRVLTDVMQAKMEQAQASQQASAAAKA